MLIVFLVFCRWGQVFILDALSRYKAADAREAENIVERVTPRLQHANCAVVLSAVKMILLQMELISCTDIVRNLCKKMAPPLVTLLSSEPEIQYVALRNINLIVQRRPTILAHEIKVNLNELIKRVTDIKLRLLIVGSDVYQGSLVFFCKYNDPIYVKMEKLETMIKLASDRNIDQVLLEFKEYATEVDVDFVRKAVRAIGRCAIKLERAAERCISVLLELIKIKVNYVVQEAIIVIKDIFRRYPNTYESVIATLCESLDTLDEPEAKASMIWIIGEYAERIDNADELLESFLETFPEEPALVQLQLLTAIVKLFLKKPTEGPQQMIQVVLNNATLETDNPDLRDRAYIYWRLLSTDPEAAKDVVLADKPVISDDSNQLDPSLLDELLANIATLASVYHKPPDAFVTRVKTAVQKDDDEEYHEGSEPGYSETAAHVVDSAAMAPSSGAASRSMARQAAIPTPAAAVPVPDFLGDLIGLDGAIVPVDQPTTNSGRHLPILLAALDGQGLQISCQLIRRDNQIFYSPTAATWNISEDSSANGAIPECLSRASKLVSSSGSEKQPAASVAWKSLPDANEITKDLPSVVINSVDATVDHLSASNVFFIAKRRNMNREVIYLSSKIQSIPFLIELTAALGVPSVKCAIKTPNLELASLFFEAMESLLNDAPPRSFVNEPEWILLRT
ncbi:hypothetical protein ACLOJK_007951 [Asimina triloba]